MGVEVLEEERVVAQDVRGGGSRLLYVCVGGMCVRGREREVRVCAWLLNVPTCTCVDRQTR